MRRWWVIDGAQAYPKADRSLIRADGGESNGYRVKLWKVELGKWAQAVGLLITVCHLPVSKDMKNWVLAGCRAM